MNYTNTKEYNDAAQFMQQMKGSRIPSFMPNFDSLLARNMVHVSLSEFHRGLNQGQKEGMEEGFNTGLEKGLQEFIVNGENQLFVDKTNGKIYPFSNNDQLLNSDKIGPIVKDFTVNEVYKKKINKYTTFVDNYYQANLNPGNIPYNGKYIDFTDEILPNKIDFDMKIASIEEDLDKRTDNIINKYTPFRYNKRTNYELQDVIDENEKEIDILTSKINKKY